MTARPLAATNPSRSELMGKPAPDEPGGKGGKKARRQASPRA